MNPPNSAPYTAFSGIGVDDESPPDELEAIERYLRDSYLSHLEKSHPEISSARGYGLLAPDRRGAFSTRFLAAFDFGAEETIDRFTSDMAFSNAEPKGWPTQTETSWSLVYRHIAETGPSTVDPYAIYMLGVNPPKGLDTAGMDEFNEFYTNVHMPEVAERRNCLRASRFELERKIRPPKTGSPQFLAVYELDERAAAHRRHVGGSYARGPEVWQRHSTPWRIWYRQLPR